MPALGPDDLLELQALMDGIEEEAAVKERLRLGAAIDDIGLHEHRYLRVLHLFLPYEDVAALLSEAQRTEEPVV